MPLGSNIKEHRKRCGLSQEKLAELVGVSRQAVTKWETGQSAPSTENLIRLAEIFGVSLDRLIAPDAPEPTPSPSPVQQHVPSEAPRPQTYVRPAPPAASPQAEQPRKWTIWRKISVWLFIIGLIILMPMGMYIFKGGMDDRELTIFDVLAKIFGVCFYGGWGCLSVDWFIRISRKEY